MSTAPPPRDPGDDADESYRRASERDASRPSEETRRAVLAHAARLAGERGRRRVGRRGWLSLAGIAPGWRPAIAGTLAVAALAGVVIAPQFMEPGAPPKIEAASSPSASGAQPAREERAPLPLATVAPPHPANAEKAAPATITASRLPSRQFSSADAAAPPVAPPPAPSASDAAAEGAPQQRRRDLEVSESAARVVAPAPATSRAAALQESVSVTKLVADPDALRRAAAAGDLTALAAQLKSGIDVDGRDAEGRTALLLATLNGRADAVSVLLAHGADPRTTDSHGVTPLDAAIAADEREIISMLRRYGAR